jgi:hypothetical protein
MCEERALRDALLTDFTLETYTQSLSHLLTSCRKREQMSKMKRSGQGGKREGVPGE